MVHATHINHTKLQWMAHSGTKEHITDTFWGGKGLTKYSYSGPEITWCWQSVLQSTGQWTTRCQEPWRDAALGSASQALHRSGNNRLHHTSKETVNTHTHIHTSSDHQQCCSLWHNDCIKAHCHIHGVMEQYHSCWNTQTIIRIYVRIVWSVDLPQLVYNRHHLIKGHF